MNQVVAIGLPQAMLEALGRRTPLQALGEGGDAQATVLIARGQPVSAATLKRLPALKLVVAVGSGYDHVDAGLLREHGILLANSPGNTAICVADLAMGLLLALVRGVARADRFVRQGQWEEGPFTACPRFSGRRLGILGMGAIGGAIARRAAGFDLEVGYSNRRPRTSTGHRYFAEPKALAEWSDYLVVACPATAATRHLVDRPMLEALGARGYLVNISRGQVVDEPALIHALSSGVIAGAALDVFEDEPHVPEALREMENVVLTAHIAGRTTEGGADILEDIVAQVQAFLATGAPRTTIDLAAA